VPALVKVKLKLLPGRTGELKAPWFAVTVWVTLSWFVQVTLVPTLTVRLSGVNEKFLIETLFPLLLAVVGVGVGVGFAVGVAVGAVVGVGVAVGAAVGVVPVPVVEGALPQAARSTRKPTASRHSQAFVVVGVDVFCMSLPLLQCYCMHTRRISSLHKKYVAWLHHSTPQAHDCFCADDPHFGDQKQICVCKRFWSGFFAFFNRLKPSATQVYLAQETSLIKFGINGKGSIFFIELGMHFGGGVSLPLVFFSLRVRKDTSPHDARRIWSVQSEQKRKPNGGMTNV